MGVNGSKGKGALNYSLEFQGGTSITIPMNEALSIQEIDETVKPVVSDVIGSNEIQAQKVDGSNDVIVKTRALDLETREALCQELVETFGVDENQIAIENIGAAISSEMRSDAITAVLLAALFMLLYIWFRFKDIRFATSAVAALLHDVLVVLAFYAVARLSVGSNFIACMLTIVGYSINATIVIFDRINIEIPGVTDANAILEELGKPGSLSFQDMSGNELLSGTDIKTAEAKTYKDNLNNNDYEVALTLTDEGTEKFAEATAANIGSRIAFDSRGFDPLFLHICAISCKSYFVCII
jgi:preprotein translocase SecF subunit